MRACEEKEREREKGKDKFVARFFFVLDFDAPAIALVGRKRVVSR